MKFTNNAHNSNVMHSKRKNKLKLSIKNKKKTHFQLTPGEYKFVLEPDKNYYVFL